MMQLENESRADIQKWYSGYFQTHVFFFPEYIYVTLAIDKILS